MRTPFGQECKYYYADFHRGHNEQACRLVEAQAVTEPWQPDLCRDCPVPSILRANACEHMVLSARVVKGFLGFGRKLIVEANCLKSGGPVAEPHVGCGQCQGDSGLAALLGDDRSRR